MTQKIRFHLDENVSDAIAKGLRRRGIDVTTTSETGLIAASDGEQLYFAMSQNRVIFTHDDDFVILHQVALLCIQELFTALRTAGQLGKY
ncbi:MAG: DUF5615 family PIN-like protein [Nostoc sp.]|uniref:DUF5615 family PIN-like protein n=1 Tax=Nostoc sp. TaxID=1180 RepID=UPI002FFAFB1B